MEGKYEATDFERSQLHKKVMALQEEVNKLKSLYEEAKAHGPPSLLTSKNPKLHSSLEAKKKSHEKATITIR